jgi:hypothetical protein
MFHIHVKQQVKLALLCEIAKYQFQRDPVTFAASVLVAIWLDINYKIKKKWLYTNKSFAEG